MYKNLALFAQRYQERTGNSPSSSGPANRTRGSADVVQPEAKNRFKKKRKTKKKGARGLGNVNKASGGTPSSRTAIALAFAVAMADSE
jgi:hypothetical protein